MRRFVVVMLAAATLSCDAAGPGTTGLFRLHSINGQILPTFPSASNGFAPPITHGAILLRANRTFTFGASGSFGLVDGSFQGSATGLTLMGTPSAAFTWSGSMVADSLILLIPRASGGLQTDTTPRRYVFVRAAQSASPVTAGAYALTSYLGSTATSEGFITFETGTGSDRRVSLRADTITFIDGVFFRRHYAAWDTVTLSLDGLNTLPGAGTTRVGEEFVTGGEYDGASSYLILRHYGVFFPSSAAPDRDSLAIQSNGELTRSTVSRYTRP